MATGKKQEDTQSESMVTEVIFTHKASESHFNKVKTAVNLTH